MTNLTYNKSDLDSGWNSGSGIADGVLSVSVFVTSFEVVLDKRKKV